MSDFDIKVTDCELWFLPLVLRVPLKFGSEVSTGFDSVRVRMTVEDKYGKRSSGFGESPLSPAWAWPSEESFAGRLEKMRSICRKLASLWKSFAQTGHPMEIGYDFLEKKLPGEIPHLAELICNAPFDLALHDAYGNLHGVPVYETYNADYMNRDLAEYFEEYAFRGLYPEDFFVPCPETLPVWHLVGGKDLLYKEELTGTEPDDGYPVLLEDWIRTDGLNCLKIKLRGNDEEWDYKRLVEIGTISLKQGVSFLSADFNCTVTDPAYVNRILDRLHQEHPRIFDMILYVEQPFPYDLEKNLIDVHSCSARKPLFMDESAHDWRFVKLGLSLGWNGVALKTCKTQTGALLSACWAKQHGMALMVQDLTNPRLATIPHVLLAAHMGTIMGVECNAMQFYPDASAAEAKVHPGLYRRRNGTVNLSTLKGSGFGMRTEEMHPLLPEKEVLA